MTEYKEQYEISYKNERLVMEQEIKNQKNKI